MLFFIYTSKQNLSCEITNRPVLFFCWARLVSEKKKTLKASGLHRLNKFLANNKTRFIFAFFPHFFFPGQQRDLNNRLNCNTLSVHRGTWNGLEALLLRAFCHNRRSGRAKKISACSWRKACHCLTCRKVCGSNMNQRGCVCRTPQLRCCSTPGLICQATVETKTGCNYHDCGCSPSSL